MRDVTSAPIEDNHVTRVWLLLKNVLDLSPQTVEPGSHVGCSCDEWSSPKISPC